METDSAKKGHVWHSQNFGNITYKVRLPGFHDIEKAVNKFKREQ